MAFYVPAADHYLSTELTRGPWDEHSQHAGPPCALLGRALERAGELEPARVARVTFEILRPVPLAPLSCAAAVVRPGRSVEFVEGALAHEGTELIRARAWRIRTDNVAIEPPVAGEDPPAGPDAARPSEYFPVDWEAGYFAAMEVRFASGSYTEPGPARAWMRMRVPLVEGAAPTALERVLVAADSGNGVSSPLDYSRYVFINTDLSVALRRLPEGEWTCLDSVSHAEADGVGLTDTRLLDRRGMIGRATQSLLVRRR
ncbi:MAG: thioesterase family protein [Thermoleophilaceae bacterium]